MHAAHIHGKSSELGKNAHLSLAQALGGQAIDEDAVAAAHVHVALRDGDQVELDDAAGAAGRAAAHRRVVGGVQQLEAHGVPGQQAALLIYLRARM